LGFFYLSTSDHSFEGGQGRSLNTLTPGGGAIGTAYGALLERKVMIVAEKKLTAKQQRFCDEYLIDLNATQAAIRAGYSKKTAKAIGSENLTKPDIKEYIEERMEQKEKNLIADQDEVLKYLTAVLRGESVSEEIVVENIGDFMSEARTMKKAPSEKDKLKAAELLGKRYSLFKDSVKLDVTPVVIGGDDHLED
jgi:phage terminase small subunit